MITSTSIAIRLGTSLDEVEKKVILETLQMHRYNRTKTAKVLGIGIRTLQRKLKEYESHVAVMEFNPPLAN
ncbi:MAG: helix-turn-helix domain-containing protein [Pseudomonadota bacterium]